MMLFIHRRHIAWDSTIALCIMALLWPVRSLSHRIRGSSGVSEDAKEGVTKVIVSYEYGLRYCV